MLFHSVVILAILTATFGQPTYQSYHNDSVTQEGHLKGITEDLVVDLGYSRYKGFYNKELGVNTWLGIRYAAPPTGKDRWQYAKPPQEDRKSVINASAFPPVCPQALSAVGSSNATFLGNEDCLFLNVYVPPGAKNLPVLLQIHGGGYVTGAARNNLSSLIKTGNHSFIGIDIQYRLGALGFLSSEEVQRKGVVNVGLLDQQFALQWAQRNAHLFGGDAERVTMGGESAGGGSVLHHILAYGGTLGTSLFRSAWAASPYLPQVYKYNGPFPTKAYQHFAREVGCEDAGANSTSFDCLVNTPPSILQKANFIVSTSVGYNQQAFLPVIDGDFIRTLPTKALSDRKLNGRNILVSNNANEGPSFVPGNITTAADLTSYITTFYPAFTPADFEELFALYTPVPPTSEPTLYATTGLTEPTTLTQSSYATGYQQVAYAIYAEQTFICPAYYLSEAFSPPAQKRSLTPRHTEQAIKRKSYKYQYSVPGAIHADDISAYFGPTPPFPLLPLPQILVSAVQTIIANFVTSTTPSVVGGPDATIEDWPRYTKEKPLQVNLNITGDGTVQEQSSGSRGGNVTIVEDDASVRNVFDVVDAGTWEGGRGKRCEFWRRVAERVPF